MRTSRTDGSWPFLACAFPLLGTGRVGPGRFEWELGSGCCRGLKSCFNNQHTRKHSVAMLARAFLGVAESLCCIMATAVALETPKKAPRIVAKARDLLSGQGLECAGEALKQALPKKNFNLLGNSFRQSMGAQAKVEV